ncbi:MAG: hypothetical protein ACXQS1_02685 [Methermicoccaceae archaeon]
MREETALTVVSLRRKRAFLAAKLHTLLIPLSKLPAEKRGLHKATAQVIEEAYDELYQELSNLVQALENQLDNQTGGYAEHRRIRAELDRLMIEPAPHITQLIQFIEACKHIIMLTDRINVLITRTPVGSITMRKEDPANAYAEGL